MSVREINLSKISCDWCVNTAAPWSIRSEERARWTDHACTAHAQEWYPETFPATVSLAKTYAQRNGRQVSEFGLACRRRAVTHQAPAYPLYGHRDGLRRNDLVTLASAFWITSPSRLADPVHSWEVEIVDSTA